MKIKRQKGRGNPTENKQIESLENYRQRGGGSYQRGIKRGSKHRIKIKCEMGEKKKRKER